MKKHFTNPRYLLKNINNYFGISETKTGNDRLDNLINLVFSNNKSGYVDKNFIDSLSYNMTFGALKEKANKKEITGEWIVFQKYHKKNYYLTLAAHREGDENIFQRVNMVYDMDFNFLRERT